MYYPNHQIRSYCVYLGSATIKTESGYLLNADFGVYEKPDGSVSHAIVLGNEDSEYGSGSFIYKGKPERNFGSSMYQLNAKLYKRYLEDKGCS